MTDEIVKMILKEADKKNVIHPSMELYEILREINHKVWTAAEERLAKEGSKKDDR